ncbi:hypothetical protein NL50_14950 [Clostridium acetobutylicum]|nr:hypothetical protein NL50_14950 [Clostridium acetobutylicum]
MKRIDWNIQYLSLPPVIKHCKKCGKKTEFICSGMFRINAQRKYLDVWLIYKCSNCNSTWNMTIYTRVKPKSIEPKLLEVFHNNDKELAERYAVNLELIRKNGVELGYSKYKIIGEDINFRIPVELHIKSTYPSQLKVAALIREKLNLSQSLFERLITKGLIRGATELNLKKCRLKSGIIVIIDSLNRSEVALALAL